MDNLGLLSHIIKLTVKVLKGSVSYFDSRAFTKHCLLTLYPPILSIVTSESDLTEPQFTRISWIVIVSPTFLIMKRGEGRGERGLLGLRN